jgi:hypothetical protein
MLQAREHTPTPSPSIVFTFRLIVESNKELGGASTTMNIQNEMTFSLASNVN